MILLCQIRLRNKKWSCNQLSVRININMMKIRGFQTKGFATTDLYTLDRKRPLRLCSHPAAILSCWMYPKRSVRTFEILARYPGAGWYWNPHTAAINIPIYFLTYIFLTTLKNISKYSLKTVGSKGIRTTDLLITSQAA